jgi:hypothetical protein
MNDLKIVYYAGDNCFTRHVADGSICPVSFGCSEPKASEYWRINWEAAKEYLRDAKDDILLLLDTYVPLHWAWEMDHGENVIEMIFGNGSQKPLPFAQAVLHAFGVLRNRYKSAELPRFTTGLLFNSILDRYQECKPDVSLSSTEAPVHQVLKQNAQHPRAIQLQPLINPHRAKKSGWNEDPNAVPRWLFCTTPKLRVKVLLRGLEIHRADWITAFPPLKEWIRWEIIPQAGAVHNWGSVPGILAAMSMPAALYSYLRPSPAIVRKQFEVCEKTRTYRELAEYRMRENGYEDIFRFEAGNARRLREDVCHLKTDLETVTQRLRDAKRQHGRLAKCLSDILGVVQARVLAAGGPGDMVARMFPPSDSALSPPARHVLTLEEWSDGPGEEIDCAADLEDFEDIDTTLEEWFDDYAVDLKNMEETDLGAEINKLHDAVDLENKEEIDLACDVHNFYQSLKELLTGAETVDPNWSADRADYWIIDPGFPGVRW